MEDKISAFFKGEVEGYGFAVSAKGICNPSLGTGLRHGLHWVRAGLPRNQETIDLLSDRNFSSEGSKGAEASRPDVLLKSHQSRKSKRHRGLRFDVLQLPSERRKLEGCGTTIRLFVSPGLRVRSQHFRVAGPASLFSVLSFPTVSSVYKV